MCDQRHDLSPTTPRRNCHRRSSLAVHICCATKLRARSGARRQGRSWIGRSPPGGNNRVGHLAVPVARRLTHARDGVLSDLSTSRGQRRIYFGGDWLVMKSTIQKQRRFLVRCNAFGIVVALRKLTLLDDHLGNIGMGVEDPLEFSVKPCYLSGFGDTFRWKAHAAFGVRVKERKRRGRSIDNGISRCRRIASETQNFHPKSFPSNTWTVSRCCISPRF